MKIEQEMVREFMLAAGQAVCNIPTIPSEYDSDLRVALIREELIELDLALTNADLVEVADAIGDLLYVVLGTAVACGIDITPIFHEIHRSNMSKFIDGYKSPSGKWIKGPSYSPANLTQFISPK